MAKRQKREVAKVTETVGTEVVKSHPASRAAEKIPLPSRRMVSVQVADPRFGIGDYEAWASKLDVLDAIVSVSVELTEASSFDTTLAGEALRRVGAWSVLPIVPRRPRQVRVEQTGLTGERLPVDEAFRRFLDARSLPNGLSREEVEAAFREVAALGAMRREG